MLPETIITPSTRVSSVQYLKDVWMYRDLLRALLERDVKVRYKQTFLGFFWVVIQPLSMAFAFSAIFGRVVNMPTQGLPHLLFYLAALIPWTCFSNGVSQAAGSMESSAGLISKVYFPRLIAPAAMILGTVIDFGIGWTMFNLFAVYWGCWTWLFIPLTPVLLLLQLCTATGIGVFLGALNAQYRDIRYMIPFLIQIGMLTTPVIWPLSRTLETRYSTCFTIWLHLNPMAGIIESYRALLKGDYLPYGLLLSNSIVAVFILFIGIAFFRAREQKIVDQL